MNVALNNENSKAAWAFLLIVNPDWHMYNLFCLYLLLKRERERELILS